MRQDDAAAVYRGQAPAGQRADTSVRGQTRLQAEVGHTVQYSTVQYSTAGRYLCLGASPAPGRGGA